MKIICIAITIAVVLGLCGIAQAESAIVLQLNNCATGALVTASTNNNAVNGEVSSITIYRTGDPNTNILTIATVSNTTRAARTMLFTTNSVTTNYSPIVLGTTDNRSGTNTESYPYPILNQRIAASATGSTATGANITVFIRYTGL